MNETKIGEKIKALRKARGLTLEQVGNAVGVGKSTVRKWESGEIANMRRDKISALAKILGTSPSYLIGWDDNNCVNTPKLGIQLNSQEEVIIATYRSMNEEGQEALVSYCDYLSNVGKYKKCDMDEEMEDAR